MRAVANVTEATRRMADDTARRVMDVIAEKAMLDRESVTLSSTLEELGLDSLALVEIVFAIEEAFGIEIAYNANDPGSSDFDISSVGAVVESVRKLVSEDGLPATS